MDTKREYTLMLSEPVLSLIIVGNVEAYIRDPEILLLDEATSALGR
jgi:ABC-type molybdenum transport system ATPase subunit/photorepair protein PhrA